MNTRRLFIRRELQNDYTAIMYAEYQGFQLTPLLYSGTLNRWTANVLLPSPYNAGVLYDNDSVSIMLVPTTSM